jgi:hypothetical protein
MQRQGDSDMKQNILISLFVIFLISSGCVHSDGPYSGEVIELDTGKPIEGAVVAADWTNRNRTACGKSL